MESQNGVEDPPISKDGPDGPRPGWLPWKAPLLSKNGPDGPVAGWTPCTETSQLTRMIWLRRVPTDTILMGVSVISWSRSK